MINKLYICVLTLLVAFSLSARAETDPKWYAVQVSVTVDVPAGKATLTWPQDPNGTSYSISKKSPQGSSWSEIANLPGDSTSFVDSGLGVGGSYEYQLRKSTSVGYVGYGYVIAGLNAPPIESRGKIVLLVDQTFTTSLATELQRLSQDLAGDGWVVIRHDVSRNDSVPNIKQIIKNDYSADPGNVRSLFLFGHIPVPYSGDFNPDGHPDHRGAWPADSYYGDMHGNWTDSSVNDTGANYDRNKNVPGDGKFDQSDLPSDVDLEVGRVDLYNMTCFANKVPSKSELDLLRQYLNKDHNFRQGLVQVQRRGLVCDNFGERSGEAFAASGWRNFSAFFGAENTVAVPYGQYFSTLGSQSFLWSYGTGGGSYYTCNGVGSSDDFAITDVQSVFTMFVGSYFGDWDNESNFLRAPLGSASYTLTSSWSGRPHWFYHAMGQGATIGYCTKLSQNNAPGGVYSAQNQGTRQVHSALMGDPTLRMHPVIP
ncbi:MAG: hypothetical protein JWM04_1805, partial [Verrucomicrobiales bacterium]|nr:hypothetical protein [Verrucomicrobiales bacterium]